MTTLREILETVDNYADDVYVYAKSLDPESDAYISRSIGYQGQGLEHLSNYIEVGRLNHIMDDRLSWHEGLSEIDPVWVSEFLAKRND